MKGAFMALGGMIFVGKCALADIGWRYSFLFFAIFFLINHLIPHLFFELDIKKALLAHIRQTPSENQAISCFWSTLYIWHAIVLYSSRTTSLFLKKTGH